IGIYLQFDIATALGGLDREMYFFISQCKWICLSVIVFFVFFKVSAVPDLLRRGIYIFTGLLIPFLILALIQRKGDEPGRIAYIGSFSFQPSELAHPILIIFFAKLIEAKEAILNDSKILPILKSFGLFLLIAVSIFVSIYIGMHLSTLIVLGTTLTIMAFLAGVKIRYLCLLALIGFCSVFFVIKTGHNYRSDRIKLFLKYNLVCKYFVKDTDNISVDSYQSKESLIAISQGGLIGTGSNKDRAKHKFLPDINTDFIYSMICEQRGFIGGFFILLLYFLFLFRFIKISFDTDRIYEKFLVLGFGLNIFLKAMVHIGVVISFLPNTGLPLPFVSYGGTALLVNTAMLAVILNISTKRKVLNEVS
ncbi:MAG: FtsW/RodA/SpoVE family cell cycle protein, partial [Candidatus Cloacimonetes bacterium]|nr:FtsW/RodA/SpoVE family cell cycle protein [Candidatus Cloacimonadota bacterium]